MDDANLDPAIFCPCGFVMSRVGGHFLAKTHSLNAAWRNPERKQIIPCGLGSAFPESAIVFGRATLVREAGQDDIIPARFS